MTAMWCGGDVFYSKTMINKNKTIMKKKYLSKAVLIVSVASLLLNSCSNDLFDFEMNDSSTQTNYYVFDNLRESDFPKTWEQQLEFSKQEHGINRGENAILLNSYSILETINTEGKIRTTIDEMFSDSMGIAIQGFDGTKIFMISDYCSYYKDLDYDIFGEIKTCLDTLITVGMKIVKLNWKQKNSYYNTIAIVSDSLNRVVYDNIASNTRINEKKDLIRSMMSGGLRGITPTKEDHNDGSRTQITTVSDKFIDANTNTGWEYNIVMSSTYNSEGKLISLPQPSATYRMYGTYGCKAECKITSGTVNESYGASFVYAWGYASGHPVSISYNSGSYTINGADVSDTRGAYHTFNSNYVSN